MARAGLDMAEAGARDIQAGNPLEGIAQMLLGPAAYLTSPINALVPVEQAENPAIPEALRPAARGAAEAAGFALPGPDLPTSAIFGGVMARKAPLKTLPDFTMGERALTKPGIASGEVDDIVQSLWENTGWDRPTKDFKPRFEINDADAELRGELMSLLPELQNIGKDQAINGKLQDFLRHDKLFENYPQLKEIPVSLGNKDLPFVSGSYTSGGRKQILLRSPKDIKADDILSTLLHETQHGVQDIEGLIPSKGNWATPGSAEVIGELLRAKYPDMPDGEIARISSEMYLRGALEAEARNVQTRLMWDRGFENPFTFSVPGWFGNGGSMWAPSSTTPIPVGQQIYQYNMLNPLEVR